MDVNSFSVELHEGTELISTADYLGLLRCIYDSVHVLGDIPQVNIIGWSNPGRSKTSGHPGIPAGGPP